jgi:L-aminopeptidase/D-esterase-like protein
LKAEHVRAALDGAKGGPVLEGSVGGGTGMGCFEFKGGIGTASRQVTIKQSTFTVGVLVQCNQGQRESLTISGHPVGKAINDMPVRWPDPEIRSPERNGSIIIVVGTDAPLEATTLKAMAKRAALGLARTGGEASPSSGDIVIAFSTSPIDHDTATNRKRAAPTLFQYAAGPLYSATIQATEEAIINSMVAARTMSGRDGSTMPGLPHDRVRKLLSSRRER